MTKEQKRSRRERLTLTTNEGKIELTEQELSRVTGGAFNAYMKIPGVDGLVASQPTSPLPTVALGGRH